jgi:hypothetical protein
MYLLSYTGPSALIVLSIEVHANSPTDCYGPYMGRLQSVMLSPEHSSKFVSGKVSQAGTSTTPASSSVLIHCVFHSCQTPFGTKPGRHSAKQLMPKCVSAVAF